MTNSIKRTIFLGENKNAHFGVIPIDSTGMIGYGKTTSHLFFAVHDGEKITTFT